MKFLKFGKNRNSFVEPEDAKKTWRHYIMEEDFIKAAKSGDIKKIKECLAAGVNIDITNPGGLNALHLASRENHPEIVKFLISRGINGKAITKRLNTALHIASLGGHTIIVQILLDHGANVDVQAQEDITPLYMAAQENHDDIVKILLEKKADLHIAAKGGFEPVDIAVLQGHSKVATMLLEHNSKHGLRALHVAARKDDEEALKLLVKDAKNVNDRAPNGYTPLHIAAKHGSIKAANFLVDQGANLNAPAKHNIVPLHVASRHGQTGVLTALIEGGANLGSATKDGLTPLHCSARDGHDLCVEVLLVHGAPITAKTRHGLTALHMAAQGNHTVSAKHILAHGGHIDDVTLDGVTPLHITAHYGHVETAKLLIEKGADIDKRARNGYTALHIASKKNREAVVQLLLKHKVSVHVKNNNGQIALHVAAFFGHVNIVLLLLQAGASLEAKTIREETVLHVACRTTQIQIIRLLLRNGAKVNPKSKDEDTPLHNACRQGSASLVSLLLDNEADPDITNKDGCTALHLAARDGHEKVVESLLDHNADVNITSKRGFTPLHEAAKKGHIQIIIMLLEKKAKVNAIGKNNLTPLHVACHYDQPDVAVKLLNSGADPRATAKNGFTPLHISAKKNQLNIVSILLERGVEADLATKHGVSPLHLAAQEGNVEIVDMLLEDGASPTSQTSNGLTPLHVAVQYNQIDVVKRLLKYGAAINCQTQSGFTPLHLAAMYGHTEMAQLLLEECAEVEAKTKNGNMPLQIASYKGHNDIVELLLKYNAPPNALNKDGYTALHIAEVTKQTWVITTLVKVTKITIKPKNKNKEKTSSLEVLHNTFLPPEDLEATLLIDANDEAEDETHIQKKVIQEDFEETFAGLDETHSENNTTFINESEIEATHAEQVENMENDNYDDFLNNLDNQNNIPNGYHPDTNGVTHRNHNNMNGFASDFDEPLGSSSPRETDLQYKNYPDNVYITGPPRTGKFLISFYVDARGATMESKQSGVKIIIPRGACTMPTRITIRVRRAQDVHMLPKLHTNESLVSSIIQMSSEGTQFLKPVIMEVPHFAAVRGNDRELIVLRCNSGHAHWREHAATVKDDQPGRGDDMTLKMIIQEIPDKIVVVSRPLKERFIMLPEGGRIESSVVPKVHILFPHDTLNTSTKVVLQVQKCDDSLLQPNDQTYVSPIVGLDPPTVLSKPITINIPCPWLAYEERNGKRNLRLLAWLPRTVRKSTGGRLDYEWQDVTSKTALSIIGDNATFTTTEFTRYWIVQTNSIETLPKRINHLEETLSVAPYSARFYVHGKLKTMQEGHLRVFLVTDEHALQEVMMHYTGVTELPHTDWCHVYAGQTIHVNLSGNVNSPESSNLKMNFNPFKINQLNINTEVISTDAVQNCRLTFMGSLRRDLTNHVSPICSLDVQFTEDMLERNGKSYPMDIVNDETIRKVGADIQESWMPVADELSLNKRDKQAVVDISSGRYDLPGVTLLEYWRSKHPSTATYKFLHDALKYAGHDETAQKVYDMSPNKFAEELLPRSSPLRSRSVTPVRAIPTINTTQLNKACGIVQNGAAESGYVTDSTKEADDQDFQLDDVSILDVDGMVKVKITEPDEPFIDYFDPNTQTANDIVITNLSNDLELSDNSGTPPDCGQAAAQPSDDSLADDDGERLLRNNDPYIDFDALEQLMNENADGEDEPVETSARPSAYELSLIREQASEIFPVQHEDKSDRGSKELVNEDDVVGTQLETVHAEIDVSFLDRDESQLSDPIEFGNECAKSIDSPSDSENVPSDSEYVPSGFEHATSATEHDTSVDDMATENATSATDENVNESEQAGEIDYESCATADDESVEVTSLDLEIEDVSQSNQDVESPPLVAVSPLDSISSSDVNTSPEFYNNVESPTPADNLEEQSVETSNNSIEHVVTTSKRINGVYPGSVTVITRETSETYEVVPSQDEASNLQEALANGDVTIVSNTSTIALANVTKTVVTSETVDVTKEDENGEELIKRMFGNQASVMGFFDNEKQKESEDYSSYGTQV